MTIYNAEQNLANIKGYNANIKRLKHSITETKNELTDSILACVLEDATALDLFKETIRILNEQGTIKTLNECLNTTMRSAAGYKGWCTRYKKQIEKYNEQVAELQEQIEKLSQQIEEARRYIETIKKEKQETLSHIKSLERSRDWYKREYYKSKQSSSDSDKVIAELKRYINDALC